MKLIKSNRYLNIVWCLCNSYEDYKQFVKDIYSYKGTVNQFSCEQFETEDEWFGEYAIQNWMSIFEIPYVKENPDDEYSDEYEIENPLTDEYEIGEKPNDNEYPVVVKFCLDDSSLDWINLNKLKGEQ